MPKAQLQSEGDGRAGLLFQAPGVRLGEAVPDQAGEERPARAWSRMSPNHIESGNYQIWRVHPLEGEQTSYTLWLKVGDKYIHQSTHASAEEAKSAVPA